MAQYKTRYLQSHFDLAVQLYGDISKIGEILGNIADINGQIPIGTAFNVPAQDDPAALFFTQFNLIVQTDIIVDAPVFLTVDNDTIKVDSTLVTADQTEV